MDLNEFAICPTHVGMNRIGRVRRYSRAIICPTHVGMNRGGTWLINETEPSAPRTWG